MRVLIAYKDSHRAYGDALARAIRGLRASVEVSLVQARELGGEVGSVYPHLVVCGKPNTVDPGGRAAWVTLSEEPEEPSEVCVGGRRRGMEYPGDGGASGRPRRDGGTHASGRRARRLLECRAFLPYSPECVEGAFSEVRPQGVAGSRDSSPRA
jgi:hypothetical protein